MRVLIVDDEMVSRTKLETLLESIGDCQTADCGTSAIAQYEQALEDEKAFNLVMLDIDMPDMQGQEVLKRLRKIENFGPHRAFIVMVTAQSDQEHVLTCLKSGCDDYIAKPFNAEIINEKLMKLGMPQIDDAPSPIRSKDPAKIADKIFLEIFNAVRSGKFKLPVMPQVAIEFRGLVNNRADMDQMAQLLKKDITLSAKLIQVANSALYRGYGIVHTIEQAISRLGLSETEQLVTTLSHRQLFNTAHRKYKDALQHLWQHSLASAYAAEMLTGSLALELPLDPFSAGLFHDIGALALLNIIAQMETQGRYDDEIDAAALTETIVDYHAMFGAKLLEMWGFDNKFTNTTLSHNRLYTAAAITKELLVVHFANLVAKSLGYTGDGLPCDIDLTASESAKELKLDASQITALANKVDERMTQSAGFMT